MFCKIFHRLQKWLVIYKDIVDVIRQISLRHFFLRQVTTGSSAPFNILVKLFSDTALFDQKTGPQIHVFRKCDTLDFLQFQLRDMKRKTAALLIFTFYCQFTVHQSDELF